MDYSDEVLDETPQRVTKFLAGIGAVATIRTSMLAAGMTDDDIVEGRKYLLDVLAAPQAPTVSSDTEDAKAQRAATAELDEWDEPNFTRHSATLTRHFPDAQKYVFHELSASTGTAAVRGVAIFLARLDALEAGTDESRAATKQADKKAVAFLAKRNLDKAERTRLKKLVDVALGPTAPLPEDSTAPGSQARREKLVELKKWYDEWAAAARTCVKKRGYLIRLGLASRKAPKAAKPKEGGAPPAVPVATAKASATGR